LAAPARTVAAEAPLALRYELVRKGIHLSAVVFPVAYSLGTTRALLELFLAVVVAVAVATEVARRRVRASGAAFDRMFGALTRGHEQRSITGATWLAVSCLAAVALLPRNAAIAALWCATAGDPSATIAGRLWRVTRAAHTTDAGRKTMAGSLACATVSFVGVWMLAGYRPLAALAIAVAATVAEAMPARLDDNLRVAGAAGIIAQLLA
jgi:phytol kinase